VEIQTPHPIQQSRITFSSRRGLWVLASPSSGGRQGNGVTIPQPAALTAPFTQGSREAGHVLSPFKAMGFDASLVKGSRGNEITMPSQSPAVTALPTGEPRGVKRGIDRSAEDVTIPQSAALTAPFAQGSREAGSCSLPLQSHGFDASLIKGSRGNEITMPSQSPAVTALPTGEPGGVKRRIDRSAEEVTIPQSAALTAPFTQGSREAGACSLPLQSHGFDASLIGGRQGNGVTIPQSAALTAPFAQGSQEAGHRNE